MSFEFPPSRPWIMSGYGQLKTQNSKLRTAAMAAVMLLVILTAACAHRGSTPVSTRPAPPSAQVEEGWTEKGIASWYGEPYHGRQTASGEIYDMHAMTAAHKTLPFGAVVKVSRRDTGADVKVRVNDRGPFIEGRIIDLSYAAARSIGLDIDGVAPVKIKVVGHDQYRRPAPVPSVAPAEACFWVQVGAFSERERAARVEEELEASGETAVVLTGLDELWRVRLGPFDEEIEAERTRNRVTDGWPGAHIVPCGG
jgi:rare lipoprotein A